VNPEEEEKRMEAESSRGKRSEKENFEAGRGPSSYWSEHSDDQERGRTKENKH